MKRVVYLLSLLLVVNFSFAQPTGDFWAQNVILKGEQYRSCEGKDSIFFIVKNADANPQSKVYLAYRLLDGAIVAASDSDTVNFTVPLQPNETYTHKFYVNNIQPNKTYTLEVYIYGDQNAFNNVIIRNMTAFRLINPVNTPILEDFEGFPTYTNLNPLDNSYDPNSGFVAFPYNRWTVIGTFSNSIPPSAPAGPKCAKLQYYSIPGEDVYMYSPCLILPNNSNVRVKYAHYLYSNYSNEYTALEVSIDSGKTWTPLDTIDKDDLKNTNSDKSWDFKYIDISQYAGKTLLLRFRSTYPQHSLGIDRIGVEAIPNNELQALKAFITNRKCAISSQEQIYLVVKNVGSSPQTSFTAYYQVYRDGTPLLNPPVSENITLQTPLNPGEIDTIVFSTTANMGQFDAFYIVKAWVSLTGDNENANDTAFSEEYYKPALYTPDNNNPYIEDFENLRVGPMGTPYPGNGWELKDNTNNTGARYFWEIFNNPSGYYPNTGTYGDHTTGTGKYLSVKPSGMGYLDLYADAYSPCIDLSNLTLPQFEYWYIANGSQIDTLKIFASDNGGKTWNLIDMFVGPQNIDWEKRRIILDAYQGKTIILKFLAYAKFGPYSEIDFDDINIKQADPDAKITLNNASSTICEGGNYQIAVELTNTGSSTLDNNNTNVTLMINNQTYNQTTNKNLNFGDKDTLIFTGSINSPGTYTYTIYVSHTGDVYPNNDTITGTITVYPNPNFGLITTTTNAYTGDNVCLYTSISNTDSIIWTTNAENITDGGNKTDNWLCFSQNSVGPNGDTTITVCAKVYINGCETQKCKDITISKLPSSIKSIANNIKIYPNPVEDMLLIKVPQKTKVEIYNSYGKLVFQDYVYYSKKINMKNLANGIYLIKLNIADKVYYKKVLKK